MKFIGTIVITDPGYIKNSYQHSGIERNTIYGDWSCMVYPGTMEDNKKPEEFNETYFKFWNDYNFEGKNYEEKIELAQKFKEFRENWLKENDIYGTFCADGGMVAVYDYERLSEKDKLWCREHPWCSTIIEDFSGDVDFVEKTNDKGNKSVHVVGTGNKPFFSVQSGF